MPAVGLQRRAKTESWRRKGRKSVALTGIADGHPRRVELGVSNTDRSSRVRKLRMYFEGWDSMKDGVTFREIANFCPEIVSAFSSDWATLSGRACDCKVVVMTGSPVRFQQRGLFELCSMLSFWIFSYNSHLVAVQCHWSPQQLVWHFTFRYSDSRIANQCNSLMNIVGAFASPVSFPASRRKCWEYDSLSQKCDVAYLWNSCSCSSAGVP
jgi:hypothetical protein